MDKLRVFLRKLNKPVALVVILLIYISSLAIGLAFVSDGSYSSHIVRLLIADIIATIVVFAFSLLCNNSSVYDPYWSVIPALIAGVLILEHPEGNTLRQWVIFSLVLFWSVRLTANWARGWNGFEHEDWRYGKLAADTGRFYWLVSFSGIHMIPTLVVFLGCLPLFYILPESKEMSLWELFAAAFTFGAVVTEWLSDEQLKSFKRQDGLGKNMDGGLWSLSRHPNYLGEISFWLGLFLFIPAMGSALPTYYSIIGFVAMFALFRFISIPMMEKRNLKNKPEYAAYKKRVPMLFPRLFK